MYDADRKRADVLVRLPCYCQYPFGDGYGYSGSPGPGMPPRLMGSLLHAYYRAGSSFVEHTNSPDSTV